MNFKKLLAAFMFLALVFTVSLSIAQSGLVIYPAKGQSDTKMQKDKSECNTWAIKESGVDPAVEAQKASEPAGTSGPKGERARGAARGAAGGAAIGAIAGDAGAGAAMGAVGGTMVGGARQRRERREEKEEQSQAKAQVSQDMGAYNKAYSACLEGRGYTVK